jgi:hypothetical protein
LQFWSSHFYSFINNKIEFFHEIKQELDDEMFVLYHDNHIENTSKNY